jgi:hypothetical protein
MVDNAQAFIILSKAKDPGFFNASLLNQRYR